jgi:hypothetical protein
MKIKYENLQSCDIVVCGGHGLVAGVIRSATGHKPFDTSISTHTGIIIDLHGQKMIGEATAKGGLKLNSLEEYLNNRKRFILGIYRKKDLPFDMQYCMERDIAVDLRKTKGYDWAGDLSFVLNRVKQNPDKYFCSEYVAVKYQKFGIYRFTTSKNGLSSPQDINFDCKTFTQFFDLVDWKL